MGYHDKGREGPLSFSQNTTSASSRSFGNQPGLKSTLGLSTHTLVGGFHKTHYRSVPFSLCLVCPLMKKGLPQASKNQFPVCLYWRAADRIGRLEDAPCQVRHRQKSRPRKKEQRPDRRGLQKEINTQLMEVGVWGREIATSKFSWWLPAIRFLSLLYRLLNLVFSGTLRIQPTKSCSLLAGGSENGQPSSVG